jgi:hypothetical protein
MARRITFYFQTSSAILGKSRAEQPPKPSLPLHKEAGPQERDKPAKELASFEARVSVIEEGRKGLHEPGQKEKS